MAFMRKSKRCLELFSDSSYLSALFDRQRLQVAAAVDLRTKKTETFSPQQLQGFWSKREKNPRIIGMSPVGVSEDARGGRSPVAAISFVLGRDGILNPLYWDQNQERSGG